MRPRPGLRSGVLQVPGGPSGQEPRGTRAAKRKRNRARGSEGGRQQGAAAGMAQSCPRAPGALSGHLRGAGVAFPGERRTWQQPREPGRRGPAPYPRLHQKGGEYTEEEFVHGVLLVT